MKDDSFFRSACLSIFLGFIFSIWLTGCDPEAEIFPDPLRFSMKYGAIIRGDSSKQFLSLVFTGDEYADGADTILHQLELNKIKASFFLTGKFYENIKFKKYIEHMKLDKHYLGAHSDQHLLYCDWNDRNKLLVSHEIFNNDLKNNYKKMSSLGINEKQAQLFLPPFEWYNAEISTWTSNLGLQLINFTPGTLSHADYTIPDTTTKYYSSNTIIKSIINFESMSPSGLNGFILLMHIGTHPKRTDKLYYYLTELIFFLKEKEYVCLTIDQLLKMK